MKLNKLILFGLQIYRKTDFLPISLQLLKSIKDLIKFQINLIEDENLIKSHHLD